MVSNGYEGDLIAILLLGTILWSFQGGSTPLTPLMITINQERNDNFTQGKELDQ